MEEENKKSSSEKVKEILDLSEAEYGYVPEEEENKKEIIDEIIRYLKDAVRRKSKEIKGVA